MGIQEQQGDIENQGLVCVLLPFIESNALQSAAMTGNWDTAQTILGRYPRQCLFITEHDETILHFATVGRNLGFLRQAINYLPPTHLTVQDEAGNNPFIYAVTMGDMKAAKIMLEKNPELLNIHGSYNEHPLHKAVNFDHKEMSLFLYNQCKASLGVDTQTVIIRASVEMGNYDFGLLLLNDLGAQFPIDGNIFSTFKLLAAKPEALLTTTGSFQGLVNHVLRRRPELNPAMEIINKLWGRMLLCDPRESKQDYIDILFTAAKSENLMILNLIIKDYQNLIHSLQDKESIFHMAVRLRNRKVFNLIHSKGVKKEHMLTLKCTHNRNILHIAADYDPTRSNHFSCPLVHLYDELLIFEELEDLVPKFLLHMKIKAVGRESDGKTARELFLMNHEPLYGRVESWMTTFGNSCLIATALNTMVVFTATPFSIEGGHTFHKELSKNWEKNLLQVFGASYGIAITCSTISVILSLAIVTFRYTPRGFSSSAHLKMLFVLIFFFIAVSCILVAYSSIYIMSYFDKLEAFPLIINGFAGVIYMFSLLLFGPVLKDLFCLSWRSAKLRCGWFGKIIRLLKISGRM